MNVNDNILFFIFDVCRFANAAPRQTKKDARRARERQQRFYGICHICVMIYSLQSILSLFKASTINFMVHSGISSYQIIKTLLKNDARRLL